jgi:hypothetical protein
MNEFMPTEFGPVFAALLSIDRNHPLDAGQPSATGEPGESAPHRRLRLLNIKSTFAHTEVRDDDMARCCLAGVWLLHGYVDYSHAISQNIDTPSGSFWHGVMHRRERDFSNAKYWFRRVGSHEVFAELGKHVVAIGADASSRALAERIAPHGQFDPYAMVDACQAAIRQGGIAEAYCRRLQQAEWELLFAHCYRGAIGE